MARIQLYRHRRGLAVVAAFVAVATVLAACSSSKSPAKTSSSASAAAGGGTCSNIPAGPIKIANIVPLSGPTSQSGLLGEAESAAEVAYFNAHDSVCGHSFVLTNYNDKGDPATSLSIARQLVSEGETIILEDSLSAPQNQIQPYLMQQHVLVVNGDGALALFEPKANPTAFSLGPSNAQYAQTMVNWAKSHNDNNIGILSDGTSFSVELAGDAEADAKAAGLTFVKTITYSPTALDLTTQLTEAKQSGIQTLFPTGFTGIPSMVAGMKQVNWTPTIVGWGGLNDFGVTASQVPAGTVDGCSVYYSADQSATQALLTPENTALLEANKAKIGVNPVTGGIVLGYIALLVVKHAIEASNSLDGLKMKAALESTKNLPTNVPGLTMSFTPDSHYGMGDNILTECTLKQGPYDILYRAS